MGWPLARQLTFLTGLMLTGCGPRDKAVVISGVFYYFPASHLDGLVAPKGNGGNRYFVRLVPPNGSFLLIYNPEKSSRKNQQGKGVPTIASVNDVPGNDFDVLRTAVGPVVCRRSPRSLKIHYTCGLRIFDAGLDWNVLFDRDLAASADAIKARAQATLVRYRTDKRLRGPRL